MKNTIKFSSMAFLLLIATAIPTQSKAEQTSTPVAGDVVTHTFIKQMEFGPYEDLEKWNFYCNADTTDWRIEKLREMAAAYAMEDCSTSRFNVKCNDGLCYGVPYECNAEDIKITYSEGHFDKFLFHRFDSSCMVTASLEGKIHFVAVPQEMQDAIKKTLDNFHFVPRKGP